MSRVNFQIETFPKRNLHSKIERIIYSSVEYEINDLMYFKIYNIVNPVCIQIVMDLRDKMR